MKTADKLSMSQKSRYTARVTSKKGVVEIGVSSNPYSESRRFSVAESAASLSVPPVLAARMGERKLRRFLQGVPGTPTRSSRRPRLALGAVVVAKRTSWSTTMGQLRPISICHEYHGNPLLIFEAADADLLRLVPPSRLPKTRPGCKAKWRGDAGDLVKSFRLPDGRVRLTISASLVRHFDAAFMRFMATLAASEAS